MNVGGEMKKADTAKSLSRLHQLIGSLCGLYTRVGNRLHVDRSYVSLVARGKRHSEAIERALISEFERIDHEQKKRYAIRGKNGYGRSATG